jgi:hypothetical protein
LVLALVLAAIAGSAQAASSLWLHVTVDENDGAKVTVNLPLALAEKALPMLPVDSEMNWRHHVDHHGMELEDIRELWAEVKNSPDMTFVTVEDDGETVKVWKEKGFVYVEVRDGDREQVDVQIPLAVVDALFAGEEIDLAAAVEALAERGGGDLVSVRDQDDQVRVWIDETPNAR